VVLGSGRSNDVPNLPLGKFFIGSSTNTTTSAYTLPVSDGDANQVLTTDGSGSVSFTSLVASDVINDLSPQLGGNLDVQTFNLFTSSTNGDIQFTPQGTGSINLDGTVKFKRFTSAPTAFEGGMYADNNDHLYFGVS
jgi:streptogramin lyase